MVLPLLAPIVLSGGALLATLENIIEAGIELDKTKKQIKYLENKIKEEEQIINIVKRETKIKEPLIQVKAENRIDKISNKKISVASIIVVSLALAYLCYRQTDTEREKEKEKEHE